MPQSEGASFQADTPEKTAAQAVMFANRLDKLHKHLRKWARRTGVTCYRLYDRDIPEVPLAADMYQEAATEKKYLHLALYERPYEKSEEAESVWMDEMKAAAAKILDIPLDRIFTKIRRKQRGEDAQYERIGNTNGRFTIDEYGSRLIVNLGDYLDTGIFLDHRPAHVLVRNESMGKRVLNLFCYTGAFSVHAAAGGAESVTSVDLSKTYLAWAAKNLSLNGFKSDPPYAGHTPPPGRIVNPRWPCVHSDVKAFLATAKRSGDTWDLIICDPPTFSNSKRSADTLDLNRDWAELCRMCLSLLSLGGTLYFSTNSRSLKFDPDMIGGAATREGVIVLDVSAQSVPEDFRNKNIHRLWKITV